MAKSKGVSDQKSRFRRLNALRVFALVVFFLTIALAVVILAESLTPGEESAKQSAAVADTIDKIEGTEQTPIETKSLKLKPANKYIGDALAPSVTFYPEGCEDTAVQFVSSVPSVIEVTSDGKLRFLAEGEAQITCFLTSNPDIRDVQTFVCYGKKPEALNTLKLKSLPAFKQGDVGKIVVADQYGADVPMNTLKVTVRDNSVLFFDGTHFAALKPGNTVVHFVYSANESYALDVDVAVDENPNFVLPASFDCDEEMTAIVGEQYSVLDLIRSVRPEGDLSLHTVKRQIVCEDGSISAVTKTVAEFAAKRAGVAYIRLESVFNKNCNAVVRVVVEEQKPASITILGGKRIALDERVTFKVFGDTTYLNDVVWTVVKGDATVSKSGVVIPKKLGKIRLRASLASDPDIYAEIDVKVVIYTNFKLFVRKIIGHFGLFLVLGGGIAVSLFFLVKPRWLYAILSPVLGFLTALLSEVFQMPIFTSGRWASWNDVGIDTAGVFCGIILASLLILLIHIICRARGTDYSILSFKTAFRSNSNLEGLTTKARDGDN